MKKKIFALLMAMVLVLGMGTTALAADSSYVNNTPPEVQELKVTWSETKQWTVDVQNVCVDEKPMEYDIVIYKNGVYVGYDYCWGYAGEEVSFDIANQVAINGSGKYTVEVNVYEGGTYDWLYEGVSEARTYTKPTTKLPTPANISFDLETAELKFDAVEGAVAYDVWYLETTPHSTVPGFRTIRLESNDASSCDLAWVMDQVEMAKGWSDMDLTIAIGVCAVSEDMEKVAYSDFAKYVVYENKVTADQIKENFDKALENVEDYPLEAVAVLSQVSNDTIIEMLKTDAEFVEKVEMLDEKLIEDLGDSYKGATSKTDAIDASKVKVVGVAINGAGAQSVELSFAKPDKEATVPEGYKNGIQLDISLLVDGSARDNLAVPVTITMPIPTGVDTKDLVILHYHAGAIEPAVIVPTVNADGTMTFIVDGFSTFVVTNQVVTTTAPVTGDTSTTAFVCSLLLLVAGVVLMKRNAFAK